MFKRLDLITGIQQPWIVYLITEVNGTTYTLIDQNEDPRFYGRPMYVGLEEMSLYFKLLTSVFRED